MPKGIDRMQEFLKYLGNIRSRTMKVAELVPEERIDWTPADGAMSFGDLLRHIAVTGRWMFVETAMGRPSQYTTHGPEVAGTKAAILHLLEQTQSDSVACLGTLQPSALDERVLTPAGASLTRGKWLRAMVEHEVHHRGQLYLMLRMCGVPTPPIFGLTSEQVREAAVRRTDAGSPAVPS